MKANLLVPLAILILCGLCSGDSTTSSPPDPSKVALMARYIIHNSDWLSIATTSTQDAIKGFPYVSLKSLSDGPADNSTGWPYLYITDRDVSATDLLVNKSVSVMATLAQSDYCRTEDYDPQDPRCAKVIITGQYVKIDNTSIEYSFGQESLFERHPAMKSWPAGHEFYVAKIDPVQIDVLDKFGGMAHVTRNDYFNPEVSSFLNNYANVQFNKISVISIDADNNEILVH